MIRIIRFPRFFFHKINPKGRMSPLQLKLLALGCGWRADR